jgi:Peptidase family M50
MSDPTPPILSSTTEYYRPVPVHAARRLRPRYWLHALLLVATCFTTLVMGARMQYNFVHGQPPLSFSDEPIGDGSIPYFPAAWMLSHPAQLLGGIPFAATVMLFFLAHEMGHYLCCRRYGIYSTLPFFIPMPTPIGTMGAVILIRSPIRSRTALFDIAIAGPIAGFVVAAFVLAFSLGLSRPLPLNAAAPGYELTYPLIFTLTQRLLSSIGVLRGAAALLPLNRLLLHPAAIAAWVGMFATTLNLLPGGQLDGGHIVFSLAPRIHKFVSRLTILILLPMAYYWWTGWLVWAILLQLSSLRHPQVAEWPRVSGLRTGLAIFAVLMLGLTMMPAPFAHSSFKEILPSVMEELREVLRGVRQR